MLLRNGGTVNLDSIGSWNKPANGLLDIPGSYGQPALDMLDFCGVDPDEQFPANTTSSIPTTYGLRPMLLFPSEDWGTDTLVPRQAGAARRWADFLATTPYSPAAQRRHRADHGRRRHDGLDLAQGRPEDRPGEEGDPRPDHLQALPDALRRASTRRRRATSSGRRTACSAPASRPYRPATRGRSRSPGFAGLGLERRHLPRHRPHRPAGHGPRTPTRRVAWPDGNTSLLRLLVSKLIPSAMSDVDGARPTQETIVQSRCRLQPARPAPQQGPHPPQQHGRGRQARAAATSNYGLGDLRQPATAHAERVRATHVVMACWNRVTARLVDGLPRAPGRGARLRAQGAARLLPRRPAQLAGVRGRADLERQPARGQPVLGQHEPVRRARGSARPTGRTPTRPAQPAMLTLTATPNDPSATTQLESYERGRQHAAPHELRATSSARSST